MTEDLNGMAKAGKVRDGMRSRWTRVLPNLALLLSSASPIFFLIYGHVARNALPRRLGYQVFVIGTWSLALAGMLLAIVGLAYSPASGEPTGRKRYRAAIVIGVLFGGWVWLMRLLSDWAGSLMV